MIDKKLKIKLQVKKLLGNFKHLKKGIKCKAVWYGNDYGGFYVCPDFVTEQSIVYSIGIGEDISFDQTIIEKHNCQVFGFDPTPKSINWIKKQGKINNFSFFTYGISNKSGFVDFYLPQNDAYVSGSIIGENQFIDTTNKVSVQMKTLTDIIAETGHTKIDILKMDIEGAEYDVIENILQSNINIDQILIEFHDRYVDNGLEKTKTAIKNLKENGYEIFGVSETFEEISFIKKDLLSSFHE